jgi:hypothetical protein
MPTDASPVKSAFDLSQSHSRTLIVFQVDHGIWEEWVSKGGQQVWYDAERAEIATVCPGR